MEGGVGGTRDRWEGGEGMEGGQVPVDAIDGLNFCLK